VKERQISVACSGGTQTREHGCEEWIADAGRYSSASRLLTAATTAGTSPRSTRVPRKPEIAAWSAVDIGVEEDDTAPP